MASIPRQRTCFSFFISPKSFNKLFEFLLYKTNRYIFPCVCTNRSQKTSQRVKNNSHAFFCSLHAVTLYVRYNSTHTRKNVVYFSYHIPCKSVGNKISIQNKLTSVYHLLQLSYACLRRHVQRKLAFCVFILYFFFGTKSKQRYLILQIIRHFFVQHNPTMCVEQPI